MTKRTLILAGLVAALAGGSAVAVAQPQGGPGMRGPRGGGPRVDLGLRGIDLTDSQREQVRTILQSHRDALREARRRLGEAHRTMAEAARAEAVDEAAIRGQSTAVANAMAEEAILRARVRAEVHGLLTAEQLRQLRERRAAAEKRMQERQRRRQERLKQRQERRRPQ